MRALGSARAKALLQLAPPGLECRSIPDVLPHVPDLVKRDALAIGRQRRQARQSLPQAAARRQRPQARAPRQAVTHEATRQVAIAHTAVRRWDTSQRASRQRLATLSLPLPPFAMEDAACQSSKQVASRGHVQGEAIAALAPRPPWPDRQATMPKVKKQLPALAALVDFWWAGGRPDLSAVGFFESGQDTHVFTHMHVPVAPAACDLKRPGAAPAPTEMGSAAPAPAPLARVRERSGPGAAGPGRATPPR